MDTTMTAGATKTKIVKGSEKVTETKMGTKSATAPTPKPKRQQPNSSGKLSPTPVDEDDSDDSLLTLSFNQDGGCLAAGTTKGFRICNVSPFQETFRRTFSNTADQTSNEDGHHDHPDEESQQRRGSGGGIGSIEMLFRCNLLALVGGGANPQYSPNKVVIWDDHCGRPIGDRTFRQRVLTVRLRRDRICVAVRDKVYVYNFANFELLDTIATGGEANGAGLLCISTDAGDCNGGGGFSTHGGEDDGMVLACPSVKRGAVRVELYGRRKTVSIDAHEGALAAMALTVDGSLLATASERGTIVRLFDTGKDSDAAEALSTKPPMGTPLREFRRGVEQAKIGCLCFSLDRSWLGCTSDRGTVHVFQVKKGKEEKVARDSSRRSDNGSKMSISTATASKLARTFLPSVLTKSPKMLLLEGENSYAQIRGISRPQACAFVPDHPNTIAVAGVDEYGNGCLLIARFGPHNEEDVEEQEYMEHSIDKENGQTDSIETCKITKGEVRKVAFHRFFKKGMSKEHKDDCRINEKSNTGVVFFSDRKGDGLEFIDDSTEQIEFGYDDTDGFVSVKNSQELPSDNVLEGVKHEVESKNRKTKCINNNGDLKQENCDIDNCLDGPSRNEKVENIECKSSQ